MIFLYRKRGVLSWSGHNASGDARHKPYAMVIDLGPDRRAILTSDKRPRLYLISPGPQHFGEFTPTALALAARQGMFGFKVIS